MNSEYFSSDELVFNNTGGGSFKSCGFNINSDLLQQTLNSNNKSVFNKEQAKLFKNLAIPIGLVSYKRNNNKSNLKLNNSEIIEDSIFDKLIDMVDSKEKKNHNIKTKKRQRKHKAKTRKNSII
jgi:hypothetical protein